MKFKNWLKEQRDTLGLTQNKTAEILGMGRTAYLELESGRHKPTKIQEAGIRTLLEAENLKQREMDELHAREG